MRIAAALGDPTHDPHGDPIPDRELEIPEQRAAVVLAELEPGDSASFTRVSDADPEMLRYFDSVGISLDSRLRVLARRDFAGMISVAIESSDGKNATVDLGSPAAEAIWVIG